MNYHQIDFMHRNYELHFWTIEICPFLQYMIYNINARSHISRNVSLPKLEINDSQRQEYCYHQKSDIIKLYQWINHTMGTRDKISK